MSSNKKQEERQARIDQIESENDILKKLNDLNEVIERVRKDGSLSEELGIIEDDEYPRKIAKSKESEI